MNFFIREQATKFDEKENHDRPQDTRSSYINSSNRRNNYRKMTSGFMNPYRVVWRTRTASAINRATGASLGEEVGA